MSSSKRMLDSLFPTPTEPPSRTSPARWAGITPNSVGVLKKVLKDNYQRWHIFFNDLGYEKCIYLSQRLYQITDISFAVTLLIVRWLCGL